MKKIDFDKALSRLANVGVLAGILFLGVELQQNTRAIEASAYQALMDEIGDFATVLIENPQSNDRLNELLSLSAEELSDVELSRDEAAFLESVFFMLMRHGDLAYYQFERGIISEARLQSVVNPLRVRLCRPAFQEWYRESNAVRSGFVEDYVDFIESLINACG